MHDMVMEISLTVKCNKFGKFESITIRLKGFCEVFGNILITRSLGARLLGGGPSGLLTSSFAPFGRSGRVTHTKLTNIFVSTYTAIMHESMRHICMKDESMIHVSMMHVSMMHVS